jgi:Tol biopolymer transport system component
LWIPFSIGAGTSVVDDVRETQLASVRQLTTDGHSWGAAWHPDGKSIYFTTSPAGGCGQLVRMNLVNGQTARVMEGAGWASSPQTSGDRVVFLEGDGEVCPRRPTALEWQLGAYAVGSGDPVKLWDGAAEVGGASQSGAALVMIGTADGDADLYLTDGTGGARTRVTHSLGYEGGATLAPNGSQLAWHAERIDETARDAYQARLASGRMKPAHLAVMVARANGRGPHVIEHGGFSMMPSFLADSRRIFFASNADDRQGGTSNFEIYVVDPEGPATSTGAPRIDRLTFADGFDGEARMSPDGKYVLFTSSRGASHPDETNVFVARWLGE